MEIQPAEADTQRDETVLLIREDDSSATDGEPGGGGNGSSSGIGGENGSGQRQHSRRARLPRQGLVETVDGDRVPAEVAQALCRKMYHGGFALLPLLWLVNVWLFWPDFRHSHDPVVAKLTRRSAAGLAIVSAVFLPWCLTFMIGQEAVFGDKLFDQLDAARIDLAAWGLVF